jgi:hypothetical protein
METMKFLKRCGSWLKARKLHRRSIPLPLPFKFRRQFASRRLPGPVNRDGKIAFELYLEQEGPHD